MNISYAWIRSLLPGLEHTPQQLADLLAMQGAPVDEITDIGGPLRDIRVARVIEAGPHPNADRLSLCKVDAGTGEIAQVVCGAPNVRTGGVYPFAPIGAHLPGDVIIRKTKIRGMESQGMLCSARELGLGKDHDGIMPLPEDTPIGAPLIDVLQLDDARIVVDVTPNRPDLLSHVGIAREVGAATGIEMKLGPVTAPSHAERHRTAKFNMEATTRNATGGAHSSDGTGASDASGLDVDIRDPDLCARYLGLIIRGVKIGPSPAWLSGRLRAIGLRPISNVVDATNYILHELGQPLHAFDLAKSGKHIVVRRAGPGVTITTLDGVERKLLPDMLVIASEEAPIAVAGVMGGANSEVDDATTDIVLECAMFDAASIRSTRRALGLSTDASYRFERGVDPDSMELALRRAAELIVATAGGTIAAAAVDARGNEQHAVAKNRTIDLRLARVAQVLGIRFDAATVVTLLAPLGFDVTTANAQTSSAAPNGNDATTASPATNAPSTASDAETLHVRVPGHRTHDVRIEDDLIEEIARRYGYDNFPADLRAFRPTSVPDDVGAQIEDRVRERMVAFGMLESRTLAFAPETNGDVALLLPLSNAEGHLRNALVPALLRRVEFNFARGQRHVRLFEIATAFLRNAAEPTPNEQRRVAGVITGARMQPHWTGDASAYDAWDIEGLAANLSAELQLTVAAAPNAAAAPNTAAPHAAAAPNAAFPLWADAAHAWHITTGDNQIVGCAARVATSAIDAPAWADAVFAIEIDITNVAFGKRAIAFRPLPGFPGVERDLALLVPHEWSAAQIGASIQQSAGPLLEAAFPFDLYRGKGIDSAVRSIAMRLRFRAADRTLTDDEVDRALTRVLHRLKEDHGVQLRA